MTKRDRAIIELYKRRMYAYPFSSVNVVYRKPSQAKQNAEEHIKSRMISKNGVGYCILTYNSNVFTAAYMWIDDDGTQWLRYYTPTTYRDINISEYLDELTASV